MNGRGVASEKEDERARDSVEMAGAEKGGSGVGERRMGNSLVEEGEGGGDTRKVVDASPAWERFRVGIEATRPKEARNASGQC
jgi:hypothetical protein